MHYSSRQGMHNYKAVQKGFGMAVSGASKVGTTASLSTASFCLAMRESRRKTNEVLGAGNKILTWRGLDFVL